MSKVACRWSVVGPGGHGGSETGTLQAPGGRRVSARGCCGLGSPDISGIGLQVVVRKRRALRMGVPCGQNQRRGCEHPEARRECWGSLSRELRGWESVVPSVGAPAGPRRAGPQRSCRLQGAARVAVPPQAPPQRLGPRERRAARRSDSGLGETETERTPWNGSHLLSFKCFCFQCHLLRPQATRMCLQKPLPLPGAHRAVWSAGLLLFGETGSGSFAPPIFSSAPAVRTYTVAGAAVSNPLLGPGRF